jgi:hypothetical protein
MLINIELLTINNTDILGARYVWDTVLEGKYVHYLAGFSN